MPNDYSLAHAQEILQSKYGFAEFRLNQSDIIKSVLAGHDVLALMPTGGGKSLCYQIPALVRAGVGIVVSPLIALMHDQVAALQQLGIKAAYLNSSLSYEDARVIEQELYAGALDLLYVAPERLLSERMLGTLDNLQRRGGLALFAIDEAHCVSQWGHDFRREYQQLTFLSERFPQVPRIALTATADQRTRAEIIEQLQLQDADCYINSFDRPNIHYAISEGQNAKQQLWDFLNNNHSSDAGIVYCMSRKKVESIAEWLQGQGREALAYHAGMPSEQRRLHQERFLREEGIIIVATIAFGMGIDKPDVRFVAHLNLPKSVEAYYQETGRAGRDGEAANAWMAYGLQDVIMLRQMMSDSGASEQQKRVEHHKLEAMLGLCEQIQCRRQVILTYFGEDYSVACGNCDNCLRPPETWDGLEAAQMALSCVYRTEQRFGVNYIIEVLRGKDDARITNNGHNRLSTFGIGAKHTVSAWRVVFRQLIAMGFLNIDAEFGALKLTEQARPVLRGECDVALRKEIKTAKSKDRKSARTQHDVPVVDAPLWQALRGLRSDLAREQGVPPYVIFHDSTLQAMTQFRPTSLIELGELSGVGEKKLADYGTTFMQVIAAHPRCELVSEEFSDTTNKTLLLFDQGHAADDIARQRNLKASTVYGHLAQAVAAGSLAMGQVIDISDKAYDEIIEAWEQVDSEAAFPLKQLNEILNNRYDYHVLRMALAHYDAE